MIPPLSLEKGQSLESPHKDIYLFSVPPCSLTLFRGRVPHSSLAPTSKATCATGHVDAEKLCFLSQLHVEAGN